MGMRKSDERRRVAHTCGGIVSAVLAVALAVDASGGELVVEPGGLSPQMALETIRAAKAQGNREAWDYEAAGLRKPER